MFLKVQSVDKLPVQLFGGWEAEHLCVLGSGDAGGSCKLLSWACNPSLLLLRAISDRASVAFMPNEQFCFLLKFLLGHKKQ